MKNEKIIRHLSFENFIETKNKRKIILLRTKAKKIYYNFQFKRDDTIFLEEKVLGFQIMCIKLLMKD